ncbi:MAG: T9SS type A sorting domain-containing protein [Bacteroidia bacterium]
MKKIFTLVLISFISGRSLAQQNYCDFEGIKAASLAEWNGQMDSMHVNPAPDAVNSSSMCAKYIRDTATYDNFKFFTYNKLTDVTPYASSGATQKINMKIYTSAPVGTSIDLQLGVKTNTTYPGGVHSIYTATTSVQHAWQVLTFNYVANPIGATVLPTDVDKIVVLMRPNSHNRDTLYFDDPTGPQEVIIGFKENSISQNGFRLFQNKPNPAKDNTRISFQLNSAGQVSLKLYDLLGKPISTLVNQELNEGIHSVNVETADIPNGIYFYVLSKNGTSQISKMAISK